MDGRCCYVYCAGSCCGRAWMVDGQAVTARADTRPDWTGEPHPLGQTERDARLAAEWEQDALMEHASIASFARFTLDLLALGAPAALVRDAQAASLDEVHHAELCFALASRYAGQALGPTALPMTDHSVSDLVSAVRHAFREGCVGETIAALSASVMHEGCIVPQAKATLDRIRHDEAAHAALAWRFLAWALEGPASQRNEVRAALHGERTALLSGLGPARPPVSHDAVWREAGRLTPDERTAVEYDAITALVVPTLDALVDEPSTPSA